MPSRRCPIWRVRTLRTARYAAGLPTSGRNGASQGPIFARIRLMIPTINVAQTCLVDGVNRPIRQE